MGALYLESTENKKQERLDDVGSQWLNCRILSDLPMICILIALLNPIIHSETRFGHEQTSL